MSVDNNGSNEGDRNSNGEEQSGSSGGNETTIEEISSSENNSPFQNPAQISTRMDVPVKRPSKSESSDNSD
ncbi:hypothetical protein KA005_32140 [bacterium]|nr:hypothetical protein [bacterium]